ncbi:MAG: thiamine-phosphate kinase [Spirochaetales bacterium]|nr:thiamine-phosphate kinase [Spirochaetales bacterium]
MEQFLKDIGEHEFISRFLRKNLPASGIVQGIGDDCAVLDFSENEYLLVTSDMMVEDRHFTRSWFSMSQIGRKLVEINVSDIHSMGGKASYGFLSVAFPGTMRAEESNSFFTGLYESADRHDLQLAGGDTTENDKIIVNLTLLGHVEKKRLQLRSGCQDGDLLCVTGTLGKSAAGLALFLAGQSGNKSGYLEPQARSYSDALTISLYATSMIDISDGLASEACHLARHSGLQFNIRQNDIPLSDETKKSASLLKADPIEWALSGGEDYELLFTLPPQKLDTLKKQFSDFSCIGRASKGVAKVCLETDSGQREISKGYEHFKTQAKK